MTPEEYEIFVGNLVRILSANDLIVPPGIEHLKNFTGKTGETYEIDLSYRFRIAEADYLTLIECKHWNRSVGRQVINCFRSIVDDIGAHKGIVVTTVGFQEGAVGFAMNCGIALFKVTDNGELHVVHHLLGDAHRAREFLESQSSQHKGQSINQMNGLTEMNTHIMDYIAKRYGDEVAIFLGTKAVYFISQIKHSDFRKKVITQFHQMDPCWIIEYLKIETCGLPLVLEPEKYLRSLNIKAGMIIKAVQKAYNAVMNAINVRFGFFPNLSWSGGIMEFEWKRVFTHNTDFVVRKLFDKLESGQIEQCIIKDNDLERHADIILEEGLTVLTKEKFDVMSEDGGEGFAAWLKQ